MKLAAKWQNSWPIDLSAFDAGGSRSSLARLGGELVDVVRVGKGDPLVLVPGLAGGWRLLMPLARQLARRYEVITYSLRGDGPTAGIGGASCGVWSIGGHAADLKNLIGQLGLENPTVFGVSFGGAVALELAAESPESVGSLIVQGADSSFPLTIGASIARRVLERFPLPRDNRFVNQFFNLLHGAKPEPGPLVDFVTERIWETDQSVMAQRLAQLANFDLSDRLWRIEAPTLVLAGTRDAIVPKARQQRLAESIAGAHLGLLEGAGHIGFLTHRRETARLVHRHLSRVNSHV